MDDIKWLQARLEVAKGELIIAQKVVDEGVGLLRKVKEENEAIEAKAHQLMEEREMMEANKKKVEKEVERLRQEL